MRRTFSVNSLYSKAHIKPPPKITYQVQTGKLILEKNLSLLKLYCKIIILSFLFFSFCNCGIKVMKKPVTPCKQKTPKKVNLGNIIWKFRLCIPADVAKKQARSILTCHFYQLIERTWIINNFLKSTTYFIQFNLIFCKETIFIILHFSYQHFRYPLLIGRHKHAMFKVSIINKLLKVIWAYEI